MNYFSITPKTIVKEAKELGFDVEILSPNKNFYVVKGNGKEIYFKSNDCGINSSLGYKIAYDKELSNIILERNGFRIPKSIYLNKKDLENFDIKDTDLVFPLVTKPVDGGSGKGVCVNLKNEKELNDGIKKSLEYSENIIIQDFIEGDEHRIIVIGDKVVFGIKRIPAFVVGDGVNNIKELIKKENKNPLRGDGYLSPLAEIEINDNLIDYIKKSGYSLDSIPENKKHIQLIGISNIGTGGTPENILDKIGKDLEKECIKIAKITGLNLVGIDIITKDLSKSLKESKGAIIEINADPGFGGHKELFGISTSKELLKYVFDVD